MVVPFADDGQKLETITNSPTLSTVQFVVGPLTDSWRFSVTPEALERAPRLFQIELRKNRPIDGVVYLENEDRRAFECFIRYLEGNDPSFTSLTTARFTLDLAFKYECLDLSEICINYLTCKISTTHVLTIIKDLVKYCGNNHTTVPSAPSLNASQTSEDLTKIREICTILLCNCLIYIDAHADEIILSEDLELFDLKDLTLIFNRDTLQLTQEIQLFYLLMRWKRCNPNVSLVEFRKVIYNVRYGLMSKEEFLDAPAKSEYFDQNEINQILAVIDRKTIDLPQHLRNVSKPRVKSNLRKLSLTDSGSNSQTKMMKKDKKPSKFLLNCLSVWTAIFD